MNKHRVHANSPILLLVFYLPTRKIEQQRSHGNGPLSGSAGADFDFDLRAGLQFDTVRFVFDEAIAPHAYSGNIS